MEYWGQVVRSHETFSAEEQAILARHFTDIEAPVFALVNLPDVVKGALFARYSRSPKSLRRLFLDEFYEPEIAGAAAGADDVTGVRRAEELYERVLVEYGDDSVAQLVGAHVAVEDASNVLTKVIEWGRLMSYLEQSTRYIPYNDRPQGHWRYHVPAEVAADTGLHATFVSTMDACFETYARWFEPMDRLMRERFPRGEGIGKGAYNMSIRAKVCDVLRGLLPAATTSNVGLFGSAQAFEALLLRLQQHPLAEAREAGAQILRELRKVMPVFMRRIDRADRGGAWSAYMRETHDATHAVAASMAPPEPAEEPASVVLTDWDPDGELKIVAAALYPYAGASDSALLERSRALSPEARARVLEAYIGERTNRRHKPGRAFERTSYRFDVVADYAAFRDLQRHRLLTLDWQPLSPHLGFETPEEVATCGAAAEWVAVMERGASLYTQLLQAGLPAVAPYAVPMAYRLRFYMQMNAREAMHLIELRTSPQGHPTYRWVGREMLRLIGECAGHRAIAASMVFADTGDEARLERLESERAKEARLSR